MAESTGFAERLYRRCERKRSRVTARLGPDLNGRLT